MPDSLSEAPAPAPPTSLARTLVRSVVGFGVWVAIGMAPFLGAVEVPGFAALLSLYPKSLSEWLIPVSGLLMGLIAVTADFLATYRLSQRDLGRWFRRSLILWGSAFLLLLALYPMLVARITYAVSSEPGDTREVSIAVVTGSPTVPAGRSPRCGCETGLDAAECVAETSVEERAVKQCFGSVRVRLAEQALALLYLTLTGGFTAAVGLLLLQQRRKKAAARVSSPSSPSSAAPRRRSRPGPRSPGA